MRHRSLPFSFNLSLTVLLHYRSLPPYLGYGDGTPLVGKAPKPAPSRFRNSVLTTDVFHCFCGQHPGTPAAPLRRRRAGPALRRSGGHIKCCRRWVWGFFSTSADGFVTRCVIGSHPEPSAFGDPRRGPRVRGRVPIGKRREGPSGNGAQNSKIRPLHSSDYFTV